MPHHDIIDLSLSTDDEEKATKLPALKAAVCGSTQRVTEVPSWLSDDFDTSLLLDEPLTTQASKRRKLSPLPHERNESLPPSTLAVTVDMSHRAGSPAALMNSKAKKRPLESDPIFFTSSPIKPLRIASRLDTPINLLSPEAPTSDDEFPSDFYKMSPKRPSVSTQFSRRTKALLAELSSNTKESHNRPSSENKKTSSAKSNRIIGEKEIKRGRSTMATTSGDGTEKIKRARLTSTERYAKINEKEEARARKAKEKKDEKERKRLQNETKAREKQIAADLAEVNKAKTDKRVTTPEMIVDLPNSVQGTRLDTQTRAFLKHLHVRATTYDSPIPNVIKWRRKTGSEFSEEQGHWVRIPESIEKERHIACLLSAKEFVSLAIADPTDENSQSLDAHVMQLKGHFPVSSPIYLIEGLDTWARKNKNNKNRAYQASVLGQTGTQTTVSQRKKPVDAIVDEDLVEDALLQLQVIHGCLTHHTAATVQTAEWIAIFTQQISQIPYRFVRRPPFHILDNLR